MGFSSGIGIFSGVVDAVVSWVLSCLYRAGYTSILDLSSDSYDTSCLSWSLRTSDGTYLAATIAYNESVDCLALLDLTEAHPSLAPP